MPAATFKDLCIDATDASVAGEFWAAALGLELHVQADGDACLTGPTSGHTVWVNHVPEIKSVKHRVHLDVHGASVDELLTRGASVVDDTSFRWVVMNDPEGGEFCVFVRPIAPSYRLYEISVDCFDHLELATWWANAIGGTVDSDPASGWSWVGSIPNAPFESLVFAAVPETKAVKNRVHLDLIADDIGPLIEAGATLLRSRDDEIRWQVLADPEGNEFCVFEPT